MKKRVNNLRILAAAGLIVLALCSVALFFFSAPLGIAAGALCIALAVFAVVLSYRYRRVLKKLLKNWVNALDPQRMEMICAFPMPCVGLKRSRVSVPSLDMIPTAAPPKEHGKPASAPRRNWSGF